MLLARSKQRSMGASIMVRSSIFTIAHSSFWLRYAEEESYSGPFRTIEQHPFPNQSLSSWLWLKPQLDAKTTFPPAPAEGISLRDTPKESTLEAGVIPNTRPMAV